MMIVFEAPIIGQNFVFPNCHVWQTNPAYPTSLFLISCLKLWGKMELPLAWQFLLVESASPDRSAHARMNLRKRASFREHSPEPEGGPHLFVDTCFYPWINFHCTYADAGRMDNSCRTSKHEDRRSLLPFKA
jgi:hypothetical protein